MIWDKIANIGKYKFNNKNLTLAVKYLQETDLTTIKEKTRVDGDNVFVLFAQFTAKSVDEGIFEAHKRYIDIQIPLCDDDYYQVAHVDDVKITKPYSDETDALLGESDKSGKIVANNQDFLLFFPDDAHLVGTNPVPDFKVTKLVVKVKI